MRRDAFTQHDLRQLPAYAISEAAGYLQLPTSTLRSWVLGQRYFDAKRTAKLFRPVIDIADPTKKQLLAPRPAPDSRPKRGAGTACVLFVNFCPARGRMHSSRPAQALHPG